MGMRRFGLLVELPEADDDGYFSYGKPQATPSAGEGDVK